MGRNLNLPWFNAQEVWDFTGSSSIKTYGHEVLSSPRQYNLVEKIEALEPDRLEFDLSQYMTDMD